MGMWFDPLWNFLEQTLFPIPSVISGSRPLYNLYHSADPCFDLPQAAAIRRANLFSFLSSLPGRPPTLLVGEAPGWRGCRFSGVPFTSEVQLTRDMLPFQGQHSSNRDVPYGEASATIFWGTLSPYHPQFFVWSSLPFHPYQPGKPLSNRTPAMEELRAYLPLLNEVIKLVAPQQVMAVGRRAQQALVWLQIPAIPIRHPSHGGAKMFQSSIIPLLRNISCTSTLKVYRHDI
jgi:uracil-DNA glycosylase